MIVNPGCPPAQNPWEEAKALPAGRSGPAAPVLHSPNPTDPVGVRKIPPSLLRHSLEERILLWLCFRKHREEQEHGGQSGTKGKLLSWDTKPAWIDPEAPQLWYHTIPDSQPGLVGTELKAHPPSTIPALKFLLFGPDFLFYFI